MLKINISYACNTNLHFSHNRKLFSFFVYIFVKVFKKAEIISHKVRHSIDAIKTN